MEFAKDEHPRADTDRASLAKLAPVFKEKAGTVTAGNSSGITDGAAAVMVLSAEKARALGVQPMARILGVAAAGVDPAVMGIGVVPAVRKLLGRLSLRASRLRPRGAQRGLCRPGPRLRPRASLRPGKLNVNGGAIALGHPIGATGTRISVTLLHEMARRKARLRPRDPVRERRHGHGRRVRAGRLR